MRHLVLGAFDHFAKFNHSRLDCMKSIPVGHPINTQCLILLALENGIESPSPLVQMLVAPLLRTATVGRVPRTKLAVKLNRQIFQVHAQNHIEQVHIPLVVRNEATRIIATCNTVAEHETAECAQGSWWARSEPVLPRLVCGQEARVGDECVATVEETDRLGAQLTAYAHECKARIVLCQPPAVHFRIVRDVVVERECLFIRDCEFVDAISYLAWQLSCSLAFIHVSVVCELGLLSAERSRHS